MDPLAAITPEDLQARLAGEDAPEGLDVREARLHGHVLGGALELALGCDLRLAAASAPPTDRLPRAPA